MDIPTFKSSLKGYLAPSTEGFNISPPLLEIGEWDYSPLTILTENALFPEKITLRAQSRPTKQARNRPNVTLIVEGKALEGNDLYAQDNIYIEPYDLSKYGIYKDIQLIYTGRGTYQFRSDIFFFDGTRTEGFRLSFQGVDTDSYRWMPPPAHIIYVKPFSYETTDRVERVSRGTNKRVFTAPPGKFEVRVLHPFGGYHTPGLPASECRPVYYEFLQRKTTTAITLTDEVSPDALILPTIPTENRLCLADALSAGYAKIVVFVGEEQKIYTSTASHHPVSGADLIDVTFVPAP